MHTAYLLCAAFILLRAVSAMPIDEDMLRTEFTGWMKQHNKVYNSYEFKHRWETWRRNSLWIRDFNSRNESTFTVAMNKFGDLTAEEFARVFNGLLQRNPAVEFEYPEEEEPDTAALPTSVDWRKKGVVTGVKNQQQCGSCWAFSATGSMEGAHAILTGKLVSLSEQNLVDCSGNEGNEGCNGGLMDYAFEYIINNNGIDTEASYPYTAEDGNCVYNSQNCGSTLQAYSDVQSGSEASLQSAVASAGPVSVAIDASHSSFQFYSGRVYYEPTCSSSQLDHGVLAVGYDTDATTSAQYWIVKNSWGTDWGMAGYIWMSRNRNNNCGIATAASYPLSAGAAACGSSPSVLHEEEDF